MKNIESNESVIEFLEGGRVRKKYKNPGETNEADFLAKYQSPYFVKMLSRSENAIELEDVGIPMGENARSENGEYEWNWDLVKGVGPRKLISWLTGLKEELRRLGVSHGDICPPNICWNWKVKELKLIDFTFAKEGTYEADERWQAPYNDEKYIDVLIQQVKDFLKGL